MILSTKIITVCDETLQIEIKKFKDDGFQTKIIIFISQSFQGLSQVESYIHITEYEDKDYNMIVDIILFYSLLTPTARKSLVRVQQGFQVQKSLHHSWKIINSKNIML